jgi:enterochelin esterase-like enzyme
MFARLMAVSVAFVTLTLHSGQVCSQSSIPRPNGATYERIAVYGQALEGNLSGDSPTRNVSVYLPPSYATRPHRRFPVLYVLHGLGSTDADWFTQPNSFNVADAADRALVSGAKEMIIVMPDAFTRFHGSMYGSSVTTGDWEKFIARDLIQNIDARYRTIARRAGRGLAGHSMGGYGALRIGMKFAGRFAALYALSPCCLAPNLAPSPVFQTDAAQVLDRMRQFGEGQFDGASLIAQSIIAEAAAWSPNPTNAPFYLELPIVSGVSRPEIIGMWAANAPLAMLPQYIPELKSFAGIAIDAGNLDQPIASTVQSLDQALQNYGIAHTAEIYPGDHISQVGLRLETQVLPFFSAHLVGK